MIDLDELERVAKEAIKCEQESDDAVSSGQPRSECDYRYNLSVGAHLRYEEAANPTAILELVAELREAMAVVNRLADEKAVDNSLLQAAAAYRAKWGK